MLINAWKIKRKMIKVRFNLGKGKNYKKWKITYPDKKVDYYDPKEVQLFMTGCRLKNNKKAAEKIFKGANKSVCAWVECEMIFISGSNTMQLGSIPIKYNPRIAPNWLKEGEDVDDVYFPAIVSFGKMLYVKQ